MIRVSDTGTREIFRIECNIIDTEDSFQRTKGVFVLRVQAFVCFELEIDLASPTYSPLFFISFLPQDAHRLSANQDLLLPLARLESRLWPREGPRKEGDEWSRSGCVQDRRHYLRPAGAQRAARLQAESRPGQLQGETSCHVCIISVMCAEIRFINIFYSVSNALSVTWLLRTDIELYLGKLLTRKFYISTSH